MFPAQGTEPREKTAAPSNEKTADLPFVKQMMSVLLPQIREFGPQQCELNRIEVVTLATAITPHNHVVLRAELLDLLLRSKGSKSRD